MDRFLHPGHQAPRDQESIELSSTDGDDRSQTGQKSGAFGDYEKPFPSVAGGEPVVEVGGGAGAGAGTPGAFHPMAVDPTVYDVQTFRIPEDRKLGQWSTAALIANRMIGTGIFSMPSTILKAVGSPAATLLLWAVGALLAYCGMSVFLELGTALPRSGGEKVYLERIYKKPKYFATCVYAVQFVLLANTAGNAVSCAQYFLRAINPSKYGRISSETKAYSPSEGESKGIALAIITVICLIHFRFPKFGGKYLMTALASIKMGLLVLVIIAGIAAGAGAGVNNPERSNLTGHSAWERGSADDAAGNWAVALLGINYSYRGWENANYVLGEVRDAPKTLKKSAPIAVISIAILYILANISYFAALPKAQIQGGGVTIAADFFLDVFGDNAFVTVIVPLLIALSALGNVLAVTFANSRVKQELGKEGALPWSRIWASNFGGYGTPGPALFLHWLFSVVVISAPSSDDAYNFVVLLFTYSQTAVGLLIGTGLLYLQFSPSESIKWRAERTTYHCWWPFIVIHVLASVFLLIAPFIPNKSVKGAILTGAIPYWCFPTVGCGVILLGVIYWVGFAKIWPRFGMVIEVEKDEDVLGNEVIRYKHVRRTRETHTEGSITSALSQMHERQHNDGRDQLYLPGFDQESAVHHRR